MNNTASASYATTTSTPSILSRCARSLVFKMMSNIRDGQLTLNEKTGSHTFGNDDTLKVNITVHSPLFYSKVLFGGSIGAGESYIDGLWEVDNLTDLARLMVLNMELLDKMERGLAWLVYPAHLFGHAMRSNSREKAKKNIISHYDLGNEMYGSFLDETMMYSSAIYPDSDSTLEVASVNKLETICRKLDLKPGDEVVEIGSGWGGFAIHAAKNYGCHVTTTTISDAQFEEAAKRIQREGLENRVSLLKKDYRDLSGTFDKLVSIEMIEAVGHKYLPTFFNKCGSLLKNNGIMLLQAITIADQKYQQYIRSVDFIQKHIFPGGCLPSNRRMIELISEKTDMVVRNIEDFGLDYAKTLYDWRSRFNNSFPSLKKYGYDEKFRRLWEFYLCYCEGGFRERSISVVHLVATKPNNRQFSLK